jgi:hypothetical protein
VTAIAEASLDPETQRRLNDTPLDEGSQHESVRLTERQWSSGAGAPFVIADAGDDRPLGLLNLQFGDDAEVASLAVSVFPAERGRGGRRRQRRPDPGDREGRLLSGGNPSRALQDPWRTT